MRNKISFEATSNVAKALVKSGMPSHETGVYFQLLPMVLLVSAKSFSLHFVILLIVSISRESLESLSEIHQAPNDLDVVTPVEVSIEHSPKNPYISFQSH